MNNSFLFTNTQRIKLTIIDEFDDNHSTIWPKEQERKGFTGHGVEGKACLFLKTVDPGVRTEKVEYFNQFKTNKTNNSLFTQ